MNRPTIDSTPGRSAGRPDTVVPKITSRSPLKCESSRPQTPCSRVFMVSPCRWANSRSLADGPAGSEARTVADDRAWCAPAGGRSYGRGVEVSTPARVSRQ